MQKQVGMFEQWGDIIRCPKDGAPLQLVSLPEFASRRDGGKNNFLCNFCEREFPVYKNIICFVTQDLDDPRKTDEMWARDKAAQLYDKRAAVRDALEIPPSLKAIGATADDLIIDLGCGTGRLTLKYLSKVRRVVAIDFSLESLLLFQEKIPAFLRHKILLAQADVCEPPVVRGAFTKAVSFQVLEHLPTMEMRRKVFSTIASLLLPGGSFVCTVYNWSRRKQRDARRGIGDNTRKEGLHDSGIYYYNFEPHEVRQLLQSAELQVEVLQGLLFSIRGARFLGKAVVPLNRMLSALPFGKAFGHLLLCRATKVRRRNE